MINVRRQVAYLSTEEIFEVLFDVRGKKLFFDGAAFGAAMNSFEMESFSNISQAWSNFLEN
jgi:hypothetical protein